MQDPVETIKLLIFSILDKYGLKGLILFIFIFLLLFSCFILYKYLKSKKIITTGSVDEKLDDVFNVIRRTNNSIIKHLIEIKDLLKYKK